MRLMPRKPVPDLRVPTLDGPEFDIAERTPERFLLLVFYRGLHCPVCRTYLGELNRLLSSFVERGIEVFALSSDPRERAEEARRAWHLESLNLGYGLPIEVAREWGLYISASRGRSTSGHEETPVFSEPGVFVTRPDRTLYWANWSTMPFARPHFAEMLTAFDLVMKVDYPARGEL